MSDQIFPSIFPYAETGLLYNYYRDYDPSTGSYYRDYAPEIGRSIESDPIGLDGGLNTYAYVGTDRFDWNCLAGCTTSLHARRYQVLQYRIRELTKYSTAHE